MRNAKYFIPRGHRIFNYHDIYWDFQSALKTYVSWISMWSGSGDQASQRVVSGAGPHQEALIMPQNPTRLRRLGQHHGHPMETRKRDKDCG